MFVIFRHHELPGRGDGPADWRGDGEGGDPLLCNVPAEHQPLWRGIRPPAVGRGVLPQDGGCKEWWCDPPPSGREGVGGGEVAGKEV